MTAPAIAGTVLTADGQGVACLVPMPDRCAARARQVRDAAERAGIVGQSTDSAIIARRMAWDAHAASEYPRPMLADAVDLSAAWPELGLVTWHLVAGATILGSGCDCQSPAAHRDALVNLAVIVAAHGLRTSGDGRPAPDHSPELVAAADADMAGSDGWTVTLTDARVTA